MKRMDIIPHSQPWIGDAEKKAVIEVMDSAMLSSGSVTNNLEAYLAEYLQKKHALFTGNGSQAQTLLLLGMGVGLGDEVILPSYVCNKVYKAVEITGATPVLADIGDRWLMEPENVKPLISPRTAAIVLPHVYGLNGWSEKFREFNIPLIEDICQSLGHTNKNWRTGTYTDYAFTSFHGTKPLGAGEGGMLFINDSKLFEKILKIRRKNAMYTLGTEMVAATALSQFQRYDAILKRRREIADYYNQNLPEKLNREMKALTASSMNFRYILKSEKGFEHIKTTFMDRGIHVRKGVDNLIHREKGKEDLEFPNSTSAFESTISIPLLPQLSNEEVKYIVSVTNELFNKHIL